MHGVRLFHFSDTHLGHQQYHKLDASGLNQREVDLYAAFHKVIDAAVAERPDLVVHAGDLFDGVRPGNRALACAMEGFLKLSRAGIPTVVIAGNHEQPRLRETGSPLRLFAHLPHVHVVCQGRRETIELTTRSGPVRVHAVPQCADNDELAREVQGAPTGGHGADILVVHGSVPSLPAFAHAEFNEQTLDPAWFAPFHYVALGHYHGTQQVAPNAWYCGAPERVSIAEAGQEKGFLDVRLAPAHAAARSNLVLATGGATLSLPAPGPQAVADALTASLRPLAGRVYADLPAIDAQGLNASDCKDAALASLARVPAGAVARLRLEGLDASLRGSLDVRAIRAAAEHALHLDLRLGWSDAATSVRGGAELRGLQEEFAAFAARQSLDGADRERVLAAAREVLG